MLILLRLVFGAALLYEIMEGVRAAPGATEAGDTTGAFYLAVCVGLAIVNALVWAPYFGAKVAGPLTGMMTEGHYVERVNWVGRFLRWLENRKFRRLAVLVSFLEGIRHPSSPAPFVTGMRNAQPGSWFEKIFAREVFRFHNTQNCVQAYLTLRRHGIDPRPHPSQEISIVLLSLDREPRPDPAILAVPRAEKPAPLKRNPGIKLFKGSPEAGSTMAGGEETTETPPLTPASATENSGPTLEGLPTVARQAVPGNFFSNLLARVTDFIRAH